MVRRIRDNSSATGLGTGVSDAYSTVGTKLRHQGRHRAVAPEATSYVSERQWASINGLGGMPNRVAVGRGSHLVQLRFWHPRCDLRGAESLGQRGSCRLIAVSR